MLPTTIIRMIMMMVCPNDGSTKHLWNIDHFLPDYTLQHPGRQLSFRQWLMVITEVSFERYWKVRWIKTLCIILSILTHYILLEVTGYKNQKVNKWDHEIMGFRKIYCAKFKSLKLYSWCRDKFWLSHYVWVSKRQGTYKIARNAWGKYVHPFGYKLLPSARKMWGLDELILSSDAPKLRNDITMAFYSKE
jgi:hypothetical protein